MTVETPAPSPATPAPADRTSSKHRVVIIGSGSWALGHRRSKEGPVDVIMISGTSHHLFSRCSTRLRPVSRPKARSLRPPVRCSKQKERDGAARPSHRYRH